MSNETKKEELDSVLPELKEGQIWCCESGCGECEPVEFDFCYSETKDREGAVIDKKYHKAYKTSCCGGRLEIWDENINDHIILEV